MSRKRRLAITLSPRMDAAIARLARLQDRPEAAVVYDYLSLQVSRMETEATSWEKALGNKGMGDVPDKKGGGDGV